MKSFIVSLIIFSVMLGGVILNSRYLSTVAEELTDCLEALPSTISEDDRPSDESCSTLSRLKALWKAERDTVALSVSIRVIEGLDDGIELLDSALRHGSASEYDTARRHLIRIVRDIHRYEEISFGSIF